MEILIKDISSSGIGIIVPKEKADVKTRVSRRTSENRKRRKRPARVLPDLETEWEEETEQKKVRHIGAAVYQDVGQSYEPPVKKVSYEVRVNQAYFDQLEGAVDLDAEYYQWKEEQEAAQNGESVVPKEPEETSKKPEKKQRRFGKRKK